MRKKKGSVKVKVVRTESTRLKKIKDRLDRLEALVLSEKKPVNIKAAVRDGIISAFKADRDKED